MKKKKVKFELWNIEQEYGLEFNSELECIDEAIEMESISDMINPSRFFSITKNGKLVRTIIVSCGEAKFTIHG